MSQAKEEWKVLARYACGCQVREVPDFEKVTNTGIVIAFCPKHKSATNMYGALKAIVEYQQNYGGVVPNLESAIAALAKAEGRAE